MNTKSIVIATPMYNGMAHANYIFSLLENVLDLKENGITPNWLFLPNDSLITRARNICVDQFLKYTQCTHLIFIDSDIGFPKGSIRKLIEADKDIICGAYPKKEIDWDNILANKEKISKENIDKYAACFVLNYIENESLEQIVEIKEAGTGFMLIKRRVFEELKNHVYQIRNANRGQDSIWYHEFFNTSMAADGTFLSEDWDFCEKWRKIGGKVFLMPDINLTHTGAYTYVGNLKDFGANLK